MLDKAARLLEVWGEPATPEEIVNAIGEGHDVRATRSRLFEDERFMRVGMTRVGLRSWGLEEYSSIAEEIDRELERRGGTADLGDLIVTLVTRFNLREASIKVYLNAPMFVLEGDTIRRRTSADGQDPVPPVTETASCYLLGVDALSWRIEVTTDTIRGSGRQMPAAIAAWLGVMPGGRRSLTADDAVVSITWPETSATGPALGSIRFLVERVEAREGDLVLLLFKRDEGTVGLTRIDAPAVNLRRGYSGCPYSPGYRKATEREHSSTISVCARHSRDAGHCQRGTAGAWRVGARRTSPVQAADLGGAGEHGQRPRLSCRKRIPP